MKKKWQVVSAFSNILSDYSFKESPTKEILYAKGSIWGK